MQVYTYRDMVVRLNAINFHEVRCCGSHHQFRHPSGYVVTVPGRRNSEIISKNVVKNIERAMSLVA